MIYQVERLFKTILLIIIGLPAISQVNVTSYVSNGAGYIAGTNNAAFGFGALNSNKSKNNVSIGTYSLFNNTDSNNTAVGFSAMRNGGTGNHNTAIGANSMTKNTGSNSTAMGAGALQNCTNCLGSVAIGANAIGSARTTLYNVAIGTKTLLADSVGKDNTAIGTDAMSQMTGNWNVAVGAGTLAAVLWGDENTAIGNRAMNRFGGYSNTALGSYALEGATGSVNGASNNVAIGVRSMNKNQSGFGNTATGSVSLPLNLTGSYNTVNGYSAMYFSNGSYNVGIGINCMSNNQEGNYNTAIGSNAGVNSTGSYNVFIGNAAGYNKTDSSNKLYVANDSNKTLLYGDFQSGQLLLGVKKPTGYQFKGNRTLNVVNGILTDSVRVSPAAQWADYVFDEDYQLPSLKDLDTYVKINRHLPEIPNAKEVAANGIELGEMNAKLLKKVEELTLYIIQQQKRIETQEANHEKAYNLLKAELEAIKQLMVK